MRKLFTDFNARTKAGDCWNLVDEGTDVQDGSITRGERVILYQDEDDFEVEATIDFRFIDELNHYGWVATPDWATKKAIASSTFPNTRTHGEATQ